MNVYPEDLGPNLCEQVLQVRAAVGRIRLTQVPSMPLSADALAKRAFGDAFWSGVAGLFVAIPVALAVGDGTGSAAAACYVAALCGIAGGGLGFTCGVGRRSIFFRSELTSDEINRVIGHHPDPLVKEFLRTLLALTSLPPQDTAAARNVRNAIRSLGLAMEKLPPQAAEGLSMEPDTLRAEAIRLMEQARHEKDHVIVASLERQSVALTRQAETVGRMAILMRRNLTLRQEVAAQVKAFQTSIAAASMNGSREAADFEALAESVAQVAQEANALADARAELDAPLTPLNTVPELATQTTRR